MLDFEDPLTIKALGEAQDAPLSLVPVKSPLRLSARSWDSGLIARAKYWSLEKINSEILAVMFKICALFLKVSFIK